MTDHPNLPGLSRRAVWTGVLGLAAAGPALAAPPADRRLEFAALRNGARIGLHRMSFSGPPDALTVVTEAEMTVKLGPVAVFRYRHHAVERWAGDRFAGIETSTDSNGRSQKVVARRSGAGVVIETGRGRIQAPASASPFTHWNPQAFQGPMFNPQDGKLLRVTAVRTSPRQWTVRGEAEIDDFYDEASVWSALRGKLRDGSTMEYRRL